MINKEYWDKFYQKNIAPLEESDFANFVLNYIKENNLESKNLIDVACGNGRDTYFFNSNKIPSIGIDLSINPDSDDSILFKRDILDFDYSTYELIYLRFVVHALKEIELEKLIECFLKDDNQKYIFIETRSTKGITDEDASETYFKSSIGEEHFRMLYSTSYLSKKFEKHFDISFIEENRGFSIYKGEDPVCIRFILRKK